MAVERPCSTPSLKRTQKNFFKWHFTCIYLAQLVNVGKGKKQYIKQTFPNSPWKLYKSCRCGYVFLCVILYLGVSVYFKIQIL